MSKTGYCFRCDEPTAGKMCPRCGAELYREKDKSRPRSSRPTTVGSATSDRPVGLGVWAIVAIVVVALLLVAIAVVASSAVGVS